MPAEVRAEVVSSDSARGFADEASILHEQRQGWLRVAGPTPTDSRVAISAEVIRAVLKRVGES